MNAQEHLMSRWAVEDFSSVGVPAQHFPQWEVDDHPLELGSEMMNVKNVNADADENGNEDGGGDDFDVIEMRDASWGVGVVFRFDRDCVSDLESDSDEVEHCLAEVSCRGL